jgi:hypothetical protein
MAPKWRRGGVNLTTGKKWQRRLRILPVMSEEQWQRLKLDGEAIWAQMSGARAQNRGGD